MSVCFETELRRKLVNLREEVEDPLDVLIEPPRWTRTISGRVVGISKCTIMQGRCGKINTA